MSPDAQVVGSTGLGVLETGVGRHEGLYGEIWAGVGVNCDSANAKKKLQCVDCSVKNVPTLLRNSALLRAPRKQKKISPITPHHFRWCEEIQVKTMRRKSNDDGILRLKGGAETTRIDSATLYINIEGLYKIASGGKLSKGAIMHVCTIQGNLITTYSTIPI